MNNVITEAIYDPNIYNLAWHSYNSLPHLLYLFNLIIYYYLCHSIFIELEWMLAEAGAVKTDLEEDPRKKNKIHDVMTSSLRQMNNKDSDSEDDDD